MTDQGNEMLIGDAAADAFAKCLLCINADACEQNNWVITCDKDGVTCDNFLAPPDYSE